MKPHIIIGLLFAGGMSVVALTQLGSSVEVTNDRPTPEVVTKEVTPDWASDEDAVQAAQDVIRKKELQAELEILTAEVAEREARITKIEKELGVF